MDTSRKEFLFCVGALLLFLIFYALFLSAPSNFKTPVIFRVEQGSGLRNVSMQLKKANIIRSRTFFEAFVILYGAEKYINYADYFFETKLPVYEVARRISKGEHHLAPVSVTIPEGFNNAEVADSMALELFNFNKNKFLEKTKTLEGYLFPDTYFFLTTDNEDAVFSSMRENFNTKIKPILADIKKSNKTEKEIITMASIIEREAKGDADRAYISGILWRRLSIGMPLQVDAVPETYKIRGLPKSPISNPGLKSIKASINPQKSTYLYYLHDKRGVIHYAKTFAEHRQNVLKYLK